MARCPNFFRKLLAAALAASMAGGAGAESWLRLEVDPAHEAVRLAEICREVEP